MWKTRGHQNQKALLEIAINKGRYAHAYLFCGPSMVGKKTLAIEFAQKLLDVPTEEQTRINPDLIIVDDIYLQNENVKIADMRRLISELSFKPYQYKYKVAIIDDFENIGTEAANSILKTLEEPNPTTILILIASNQKAVLPTIASRAQVFYFKRQDLGKESQIYFDGKIGKALRFENEEIFRKKVLENSDSLKNIINGSLVRRLALIKAFAELESDQLSEVLHNWLDEEHYYLLHGSPQKYKNLELLSGAIFALKENLNKKLILQNLFLHMV